ncbi:MAG: hypothetical protein DRI61_01660 [Chloroflexi bacterium]|nr:MAG: hypothetical protein DRI61_01660 [Chloroflexota bacterium]HDN79358.1 hypothetical protein [Chloroflexota bacterium]
MMRLKEAKRKFKGEWIAFKVHSDGEDPEGEVVLHNKDRRAFNRELVKLKLSGVYITYAGPVVPEDYAVMF